MTSRSVWMVGVNLLTALPTASRAQGPSYAVAKGSEVSFVAKITASSFVAKSEALSGSVDYDAKAAVVHSADLVVKADSFDTGVSMRNEHMRDKYLEAGKYPTIRFQLADTRVPATVGAKGQVQGTFVIKGAKKALPVELTLEEISAGGATVTARFKLNVTDYGIPQPRFTVVSMEPVVDVTVKLVLQAK